MEPVYYVIAILGCSRRLGAVHAGSDVPTHYASREACSARTQQALLTNNDFDFPTLVAECRATDPRTIAAKETTDKAPANALRG